MQIHIGRVVVAALAGPAGPILQEYGDGGHSHVLHDFHEIDLVFTIRGLVFLVHLGRPPEDPDGPRKTEAD